MDAGQAASAEAVAVAFYDYHHLTAWEYQAERWFHAASTIKVPVLLGAVTAIAEGRLKASSRVHVRNRFLSVVDGKPFRIDSWQTALETRVAEHFTLSELMTEWLKPIGMRGWSQVVFRREGDRTRHTFSIDYLLAHLDAWERASRT